VPSWSDFGGFWNTLREIDVSAIRAEAEGPLAIAIAGQPQAIATVVDLLRAGAERFGAVGLDPLVSYPLPLDSQTVDELRRADLIVLAIDSAQALAPEDATMLERAASLEQPTLTLRLAPAGSNGRFSARLPRSSGITLDPAAPDASARLAAALAEQFPDEQLIAAARRLPGLRPAVARKLIGQVSMSNATYALASGIPAQIPLLAVPFAAADIFILTKNQAIMVYKLALALGAPPDFQARIREVLPVVGGAFAWRELARTLVGLIPFWGLVPKIAVAYAGTYVTGYAAWRWYAQGDLVSPAQLRRISKEALELGRQRAAELIEAARQRGEVTGDDLGFWGSVRRRLPFGRSRSAPSASPPALPPASPGESESEPSEPPA
jgi:uncharacterized protein (DUF697 family)